MPTDTERREVARRLRELRMTAPGVTSVGHGYLWSLLWAVFGDELEELDRSDWLERMCSRLAALIEPGAEELRIQVMGLDPHDNRGDLALAVMRLQKRIANGEL